MLKNLLDILLHKKHSQSDDDSILEMTEEGYLNIETNQLEEFNENQGYPDSVHIIETNHILQDVVPCK
jgi:hypothetical protein